MKLLKVSKYYISCLFISAMIISCKHAEQPKNNSLASNLFTYGYCVFYGSHYDYLDIKENVVAMSLFSPSLAVDSAGYYVGTGTNLLISDIFLAPSDTLLPNGSYSATDSASAFTFLRGQSFDGNPIGAYMLVVTESGYTVEVLTDGTFELQNFGDSVRIDFDFTRSNGKSYTPSFKGLLPMYDARMQ